MSWQKKYALIGVCLLPVMAFGIWVKVGIYKECRVTNSAWYCLSLVGR